jgi:twitching motility protein PilT
MDRQRTDRLATEQSPNVGMRALLDAMISRGASDLHLSVGERPKLRIDGRMTGLDAEKLSPKDTQELAYSVLTEQQKKRFEQNAELDFSFAVPKLSRFRGNVFRQRGSVAMAIRTIPFEILTFEELGLPPTIARLAEKPRGLVLVTGPTGSGKSTTLAAMIDKINSEREGHIITIEDPIEFVHNHKKCLVNQRELGSDTDSFPSALKYVLRQDPDVILIGEMRDQETIGAALTIAETGHLALATLHTNSTAESINRIIDAFPAHQQGQIRAQLAFTLEGVVTQVLLPRPSGTGRVAAVEIMLATQAIRTLIRDDKIHQIYSALQTGKKLGMQTMNDSLYQLYMQGDVAIGECLRVSSDPAELRRMLGEPEEGEARGPGPRKGEVKRPGAATSRR